MENTKLHVSIQTFQFNQEVLDKRIEHARFQFLRSYAAVDRYDAPVSILMPKLQHLFAAGRVLSENHPTITTGGFTVFLLKEDIADLLENVAIETKTAYLADLEVEKQKQQQILEQQLYQTQVDKETKKATDREAKLRADASKEASEFFANLSSEKGAA